MAKDLQSRLNAAAEALGPSKMEAGGTSLSHIPGKPFTRPYAPRASQAVAALDYDSKTQDLFVTYTSGGKYRYSGVSSDTYYDFATTTSKGHFVNETIKKGGYQCQYIGGGKRKRAVSCQ